MKPGFFVRIISLLLIALFGFVFISSSQEKVGNVIPEKIDSLQKKHKESPVVLSNDTLFYIYSKSGLYTPQQRAEDIQGRIKKMTGDPFFRTDSLTVISVENTFGIIYQDMVVMTITNDDVNYFHQPKEWIAEYYKKTIADSINKHNKGNSLINVLKQIGLIVFVIAILFFLIKYTNKLFNYFNRKIVSLKGTVIKGVSIQSYNLLDEKKATEFILFLLKMIKYFFIFLLLYLALPILFSIFPETMDIARKLLSYVTSPLVRFGKSILNFIPNIITIVIVVIIFRWIIKGINYLAKEIEVGNLTIKGFYPEWATPTYNIVRTLLYIFMFIIIFPYLPGADSKIFQGVSVFLGIIVSLGSTSLIGNVVSGLVLTYMRPFKVGDHIQIGDILGTIIEKTPFVTRIRTHKNEDITIPNSNVMAAHTVNFTTSSQTNGLILHTSVTIGYDASWKQVHELLIEAANRTEYILKKPAPFVLQKALNDFYVEYQINGYTKDDALMMKIYSELHQNIQDTFNEAGVEIMSPHYRSERDGNQTTIPTNYLPTDYRAPGFRVESPDK